jgi:hypothetical protein
MVTVHVNEGGFMTSMEKPVLLLTIPMLVLIGCSHTIPDTTARPQPPPQIGKTPPTIQPLSATAKQIQAPESLLPVTMTADLTSVQRSIQAALPEQLTDDNHPLSSDYRWRFIREGEPEVVIQDGLVKYQAVYRGEIDSTAARACRLDPLYPVIEGTGRLALREQGQNLLVTMADPQTTITLKPESDSKCNMFNIPVKDQLAELFKQQELSQRITQSVDQAGYSIPLQPVWDGLQAPMPVSSGTTQLCLYGQSREFIVGSLKGPAQQTTVTGLARQTPVAVYQTPCQKPAHTAPMKVHMDNTAAAQEGQPYTVLLTVPVSYAVLNHQLQQRLFHQTVTLPTTFNNSVMIERAVASDVNGRTLIATETSGDLNGTLYYWGTPKLEQNGNVISIRDLQMANESKIALDDVKTGYWQMIDQELKERLQQATTIDLSQRLGNMKNALSGQHKSGGLVMDLLLARQEGAQVTSTKDALLADVLLEGTASATSRLAVREQARREVIDQKPMEPSAAEGRPRSAHAPQDQSSEDLPGRR